MVDIVDLALRFMAEYGLVAIFILLVLDGALLLPVFPGEIVLIMAVGAYAHSTGDLVFLIVLTTAAGLLGSLLLYGVTRGGGRRLVERYPRFFMMPEKRREKFERSFRHPVGQTLVLFLRLIPFTRILVNIPAGLAKMPIIRFVVMSTIGLGIYHAGFLWFTYEANRPDSAIASQRAQLQDAYASPAWDFVQANAIVSSAALLLLGAIISVRASIKMDKDPERSSSLVGILSSWLLLWGGIALAVAIYMDAPTLYRLAGLGGLDVRFLAEAIGVQPAQLVLGIAALSMLVGALLMRLRRTARAEKARRLRKVRRRIKQRYAVDPRARPVSFVAEVPEYALSGASEELDADGAPQAEGHRAEWDDPAARLDGRPLQPDEQPAEPDARPARRDVDRSRDGSSQRPYP
jgi:membrane protein DedA with SNARE-associated domain